MNIFLAAVSKSQLIPLLMLGGLMIVMVLVSIIPQKKRKQKAQEMMASLKVGTKIKTIGGFVGEIKGFDDTTGTIVLNIARGEGEEVLVTIDKSAVYTVLQPQEAVAVSKDKNLTDASAEAEKANEAVLTEDELESKKREEAKKAEKEAKKAEKEAKKAEVEEVKAEVVEEEK